MVDVFVSYKKEDQELAAGVIAALNAEGYSAWWDDRLAPAEHWDEKIEQEISSARAVLVLWTPLSVKSQWVRSEAEYGKKFGKLVPVTLRTCELPIAFSLVQAVDLTHWSGKRDDRNWMRLTAWLRDLVEGAQALSTFGEEVAPRGSDWRAVYGKHVNGEPILDGKAVTRSAPAGTLFKDGPSLPLMNVVAGGTFTMGAPAGEVDSHVSERPQRQLSVAGPFALGIYPVTFEEWDAAIAAGAVSHRPTDMGFGRGRIPAVNISWTDAQNFVQGLCRLTGESYRMPSEAEWEYACRAGTSGAYSFADQCTQAVATFGAKRPTPVGLYAANRFGLYDMHGNVREWVADLWHDNYDAAPVDAIAWTAGHGAMRVTRGGGWVDTAKFLRSASRGRAGAGERCGFIGLRVARDIG
jgi:formylglycine-generating enzyme required for sulfatase activity